MKKKHYQPPTMKVVEVQQTQIICASTNGTFSLSNNGIVEAGSEEDWSDTILPW